MYDLTFRFDPTRRDSVGGPTDPADARQRLEDGNRAFAAGTDTVTPHDNPTVRVITVDADHMGLSDAAGNPPTQRPFAAVLGCSDARVPLEIIFGQACNDLFVVRVAGNVLGAECLGSLDYAVANLGDSLKLIVVLGHRGCGAVTAAVDAFIDPAKYLRTAGSHPLRAIVDRIFVSVRAAHKALEDVYTQQVEQRPNYRQALIETTIALNAAITAATLKQEFRDQLGPDRQVVYGVYDLSTRRVKLPLEPDENVAVRLAGPPNDPDAMDRLGLLVAGSAVVRGLLT